MTLLALKRNQNKTTLILFTAFDDYHQLQIKHSYMELTVK